MAMGDDGMDMGMMPPMAPMGDHGSHGHGSMMHMTFFWGMETQVLFTGWPGGHGLGMYFLSLLFVAAIAVLTETLSAVFATRKATASSGATLTITAVIHGVRMGLAYVLMLAVMSFNGGVLIAALVGHALGFILSRSFRSSGGDEEANNRSSIPKS